MIGWLKNLLSKRATYSTGIPPRDPALVRWMFGGQVSDAGIQVNEHTALTYSAVWAAVRRISESLAGLPLRVYRKIDANRIVDTYHPSARLLLSRPNPEMTWFTFLELLQAHVLITGNGYAEIEFDRNANPKNLWPLTPNRVRPHRRPNGSLAYDIYPGSYLEHKTPTHTIEPVQMLHVKGLGYDGIVGYSVVTMARQSIGLGLAEEQFGATFFGNGARPDGVLTTQGMIGDETATKLRQQWEELYGGSKRSHKIAILEEGLTYEKLTIPPNDGQFLESRQFQIADIARWFNIQPHMIGDLSRSTFSNIEVQGQEFVTYTLRPWFVRWEQELDRKLFPFDDGYSTEFDADELVRGTIETRYKAYNTGRNGGWLSFNDIRRSENMPTIDEPWADQYWWPLNIGIAGEPAPVTEQPSPVEPGIDPLNNPEIAEDIATALNGAQVTALVDVVQQVFSGQIPVSAAVGIITASFPIEQEEAEQILAEAGTFVLTPKDANEGRSAKFDESKIKRQPDGKFGSGGGGGGGGKQAKDKSDGKGSDAHEVTENDLVNESGDVHEVTDKDLIKDNKFSAKVVNAGKVALKLVNAMPTASKFLMKEAGYSEKVQNVALAVATIGDWSVPGIPAGSALVSAFAISSNPTMPYKLAKKAVAAAKERLAKMKKPRSSRSADEDTMMAVAEYLHSAEDYDTALATFAAALDETGNPQDALELAKEVNDDDRNKSE